MDGLQSLNYLLSGILQKILADSDPEKTGGQSPSPGRPYLFIN